MSQTVVGCDERQSAESLLFDSLSPYWLLISTQRALLDNPLWKDGKNQKPFPFFRFHQQAVRWQSLTNVRICLIFLVADLITTSP